MRSVRPSRCAVSTENLPATNAKRYVGSGGVSANVDRHVRRQTTSDRLPAPLADRLPPVGHGQRQRVAGLQIRLVEAGERQPRPRGDEQRVQKVVVAVEGLVAGRELELDPVGSGSRHLGGHDDVTIDDRGGQRATAGPDGEQPVGWLREIEDQLPRGVQNQVHDRPTSDRGLSIGGNRKGQVVLQVPDRGCPFPGKGFGDATAWPDRGFGLAGPE